MDIISGGAAIRPLTTCLLHALVMVMIEIGIARATRAHGRNALGMRVDDGVFVQFRRLQIRRVVARCPGFRRNRIAGQFRLTSVAECGSNRHLHLTISVMRDWRAVDEDDVAIVDAQLLVSTLRMTPWHGLGVRSSRFLPRRDHGVGRTLGQRPLGKPHLASGIRTLRQAEMSDLDRLPHDVPDIEGNSSVPGTRGAAPGSIVAICHLVRQAHGDLIEVTPSANLPRVCGRARDCSDGRCSEARSRLACENCSSASASRCPRQHSRRCRQPGVFGTWSGRPSEALAKSASSFSTTVSNIELRGGGAFTSSRCRGRLRGTGQAPRIRATWSSNFRHFRQETIAGFPFQTLLVHNP